MSKSKTKDPPKIHKIQTLAVTYRGIAEAWMWLNRCDSNTQHVARVGELLALAEAKTKGGRAAALVEAHQLVGIVQGILLAAGVRTWERISHDEDEIEKASAP